ncbi:TolC family protein [Mucilaginibacter yixingensis]|nr:TolC family protein [Mucilaginibacter yixingensis]
MIPDVKQDFLQKLIDTAKKNYPEMKIRSTQIGIARTTYHQAQISWFDMITPSYIYNPQNTVNVVNPNIFFGFSLAVTVNIGQLLAKPYQIKNARQAVDVAYYQQQEYILTLTTNVKRLYYNYVEALAELRVRVRAEQDAGTNVKQMKTKFEKAEASLKDYNDALVIMYTQTSYKIQGERSVLTAKVDLEEFIGKKLEDIN